MAKPTIPIIELSNLTSWGWDDRWAELWRTTVQSYTHGEPGRVVSESRGAFEIVHPTGLIRATPLGRLRKKGNLWPAVGDWVHIERHSGGAQMTHVLPRRTCLQRKAAGESEAIQVLAANIDRVFVVTSLNSELNVRRLERFFVAARDSGAAVSLVLSKADLVTPEAVAELLKEFRVRFGNELEVHQTSTQSGLGIAALLQVCQSGNPTSVFLGTSGVGKSSLVNALLGANVQVTAEIRLDDDKGRHTTTGRNALQIRGGGIIIDTPGIRELQLTDVSDTVDEEFKDIEALGLQCKFTNCTHEKEKGCAIQAAFTRGELSQDRFISYQKLKEEAAARALRLKRR